MKSASVVATCWSEIAAGVASDASFRFSAPSLIAKRLIVRSSGGAFSATACAAAALDAAAAGCEAAPDAGRAAAGEPGETADTDEPAAAAAAAALAPADVGAAARAAGGAPAFSPPASFITFSTPALSRASDTTGRSIRMSSKCSTLRSGSSCAAATCTACAAKSGSFARLVTCASFRSRVPDTRREGVSPAIAKFTSRLLESRPERTSTGSFVGAYDSRRGTSSPSNFRLIDDSRDCANGFVLPSIAIGLPSRRARSFGSTKMSVFDGSVAMNGMPTVH